MATRVKRLAVGIAALVALGAAGAGSAVAQTPPTPSPATATFSSPASAPATQPIWVRSITPCPVPTPGVSSWVVARVLQAVDLVEGDVVWGDVRENGDWDVTLPAPPGPGGGATARYLIQVQCGTTEQPPDEQFPSDITPIIRQRYVSRVLEVTSGPAAGAQWIDGPVGGPATTTTTSSTVPTSSSTTPTTVGGGMQVPGVSSVSPTSSGIPPKVPTKSSLTSVSQVQAEILERAAIEEVRRTAVVSADDLVQLNASPASAARNQETSDGGIPAWSFACAAALAVGAVLAWGQRRSAPVEIDE